MTFEIVPAHDVPRAAQAATFTEASSRQALSAVLQRHFDREFLARPFFPENFGQEIFEPLGFTREPLTQWVDAVRVLDSRSLRLCEPLCLRLGRELVQRMAKRFDAERLLDHGIDFHLLIGRTHIHRKMRR